MNAQDCNKDLKVQKVKGEVLKGAFAICEVTNTLIKLKNNKDISGKELRLQLSNVIKICTKSLTFLGMANVEGDNIRRQYLPNVLPPKLVPFTKDVPTPSKFLLGNNLNDRIDTIETSQKMLQTYSDSPYCKNSKTYKDFPKTLEIKVRRTTAPAKPEVTTTTKNNDRGINDCNTTRGTKLQ